MRLEPSHPYLLQSSMERQFMDGFRRGRDRRAWLDARGQKRVENIVEKIGPSNWHWQLLVEKQIHAEGCEKSENAASQACEDANMDRISSKSMATS